MLVEPVALSEALDHINEDQFSLDSHRRIFRAMRHISQAGDVVDLTTLRAELDRRKELSAVGDMPYLYGLTEGLPRRIAIGSYAKIIKNKAMQRDLLLLSQSTFDAAEDQSLDARTIAERAVEAFREIAENHEDYDLERVGDFLDAQGPPEAMFERMATVDGIKSGFAGLDELLSGFQPEDLIIVAARPSMGKSAWACNVASWAAIRGGSTTALFVLEQKRQAAIRRMLSSSARIDYKNIRANDLRSQDRQLLIEKRAILQAAPLYIDDNRELTATRIKNKCLRLKSREGLDLVLVDQLSHVSQTDCKQRDFRLRIGEQTKMFKRLAQELKCPVIVFNQLGRDVGKRSDPKPRLEDLKESGNIEEDADVVILLHRPEYYDRTDESLRGKGEMIVAKQREGETKTIHCTYDGRIMRWEDVAQPSTAKQQPLYSPEDAEAAYMRDWRERF